jgi:hypothetical protein
MNAAGVILLGLVLVMIGASAGYFMGYDRGFEEAVGEVTAPLIDEPGGEESVFCTQDAQQCPDGSYVGRTGPDCEFAPCPGS